MRNAAGHIPGSENQLVTHRAAGGTRAEELLGLVEHGNEDIHFVASVVKIKTGARGGGEAKLLVERHGAVMTRADGDAVLVGEGGNVVRMHIAQSKSDQAAALLDVLWTVDRDFGEVLQAIEGVLRNFLLMLPDLLHADAREIIN